MDDVTVSTSPALAKYHPLPFRTESLLFYPNWLFLLPEHFPFRPSNCALEVVYGDPYILPTQSILELAWSLSAESAHADVSMLLFICWIAEVAKHQKGLPSQPVSSSVTFHPPPPQHW